MAIQGVFNTGVTKATGPWITNSFVQLTAFFVCAAFYLFSEMGKTSVGDLFKIDHKYMLCGGVIGAFITFTVIKSMAAIGPAQATLAIVISQILVGYLIEVFGLFGVEKTDFLWNKLLGIAVALVGLILYSKS